MQAKAGSIRVFKSDFLEKFTHVNPLTPILFWSPVVAGLIWRSWQVHRLSFVQITGLGALGFFTWTLAEYLLHRFVFHFDAETPLQKRIRFLIHGLHHDDPQDATRLVMPPLPGLILAVALFAVFRLPLGDRLVEPFFAFFLVGYLCYDYIHFYVHHFNPTHRVGKAIKQHHMMHHFVTHEARWGVSSPLWDHVFGTAEQKKKPRTA